MADAMTSWDVPAGFNFARDVIDRLAREDRLALLAVDANLARREYTFAEVSDATKRWASVLRDAGSIASKLG